MNTLTHFLVSWSLVENTNLDSRGKAIVTWLGVLPDLDGLGGIIDVVAHLFGDTNSDFYAQYHHHLFHGLFGALFLPFIAVSVAHKKLSTFLFGVLVIHLHLFCDFIGSRGFSLEDIWPIHYLAPFSENFTFSWSGQWQLNAWQNVMLTIALLIFMFMRSITHGHSVVSLFSNRAHEIFVYTIRSRWEKIKGVITKLW